MIADIVIGYFIPGIFGWIFLGVVVFLESYLLQKRLTKFEIASSRIVFLVLIANILTTLVGYGLGELLSLNTKERLGHLINIIPIEYYYGESNYSTGIVIFIASFIGTMLLETLTLFIGLRSANLSFKSIFQKSLLINVASYLLALLILVGYAIYLVYS
jgi:hypothetical protein